MINKNYISYTVKDEELLIEYLNIPKNIRRRGYGTKLVESVLNENKNNINLVTIPCNACKIALLFWIKLGFSYYDNDEEKKAKIVLNSNCRGTKIFDFYGESIIVLIKKYD